MIDCNFNFMYTIYENNINNYDQSDAQYNVIL